MKGLRIFLWILIVLINCSIVKAQSFEKDWQWLKFTEKITGTNSFAYENALLNIVANNLNDSLMVFYYDSIATRLNAIIPSIESKYGITSVQYWDLIDASSVVLTESAYNKIKIKKRKQLVSFLKSLEKNYIHAGENEYIFAIGLSDVYNYLGEKDKAFYWGEKRFDFAKKSNNINEIAGAYCVLADLYIKYNDDKNVVVFFNQLVDDASLLYQVKRNIIDFIINSCYEILSHQDKSDMANCLLKFEDIEFLSLQSLCYQASQHKDYFIFDIIENSKSFHNWSIVDRFEYYKWNSTMFFVYGNPHRCVDYLLNAINLAQSNNRDDLNWHYNSSNSTYKTHNWLWVASYYENDLEDRAKALFFYDKNLEATKDYYGENSSIYYNELLTQASRYDLWRNDIEKVAYYDSLAVQVSLNVFGINSKEHVNALSHYLFCLRRKNQHIKALLLCNEYLSNTDTSNVYLHRVYNQIAMSYKALGMDENALIYFLIAINETDDEYAKSTYALNLSPLLNSNDANSAIEFVEKYQPNSNNPVENYTFLNTKANILANIDRNKAYKIFCDAEKYEASKDVQLLVNRQITHYMDKAKVAPDLHLSFSALQQALKIFDCNNTADSIMYAHIIADIADYYNSVREIEKAAQLYKHASDVYVRNSKEISIDFLDFCDRNVMFGLSHGFDPQLIYAAEQSLSMRRQMQGEMNLIYNLRRFQLLDTYSRFGYEFKADSLAEEIKLANLPNECVNERDYYLGIYEQYSKKDLRKAAAYYEKYLSTTDLSIGGTRVYGDLMDIYKELGEYDKFDNIENLYISTWYKDIESKWYHITDSERQNFLLLLKGWQISLANYACTQNSIENAANASLFCKGRLTRTTKAINEELSRLGKNDYISEISETHIPDTTIEVKDIHISDHIISKQDSIYRGIVYNDLSTKNLANLVNSNVAQVKKNLLKGDVGIDFVNIDTTIYAYVIRKDRPVEFNRLSMTTGYKNLTQESLKELSSTIKGAKRIFFSPSENMAVNSIESFIRTKFPNVEVHRVLSLGDIHKSNSFGIKNAAAIGNPRFNDELTTKTPQNRGNVWQPLPGTKVEIDSISNMLKRKRITIYSYTDNEATEAVVKELSRKNIDLIHIATHGFFNSESNESGLLFTGANRTINGEPNDSTEDGILTCEEIEGLRFPNLKLIVLSACETGLGESNIDGVWGLQRAFRIAGAQNMIVSLKKVDDDLTQAFMISFYESLTSGKSIYNSFWKAMDNADEDTRNSFILIE